MHHPAWPYDKFQKRRGISEAVTVVVLLAVIAAVSFFAISNSAKNTTNQELSVSEAIEVKGSRSQELLSIITRTITPGYIELEIVNYGHGDIGIKDVLIDGSASTYTLWTNTNTAITNKTITPREILKLQINGAGNSVQIITQSNNIINLPLD